ncbi:MAG: hypothetical protein K0S33_1884 [Bacteroidetes bacterium]|jgi:hypothetical protein|nr:hypothetical protein [Bacteroidota bacterium]
MNILLVLESFIEKVRWKYEFPLTKETRLYEDLGLYGDDAVEFFEEFGAEFNVVLANFNIAKYFKGEGWSLKEIEKGRSLTLYDLEKAIKAGRLDEDIINS